MSAIDDMLDEYHRERPAKEQVSVRFETTDLETADEIAESCNLTRADVLRYAMKKGLSELWDAYCKEPA